MATGGASQNGGPGSDGGAGTVYIVQGTWGTHVRSYSPLGINAGHVASLDSVTLAFNKALNVQAFVPSDLSIDGPMGRFGPLGVEPVGDRTYRFALPARMEDGIYRFAVQPSLKDIEGLPLDQDADGIPGEPEDIYSFTLTLDSVPPRVTTQSPAGDVAGTMDHVNAWFSEAIDKTALTTADVAITRPDGQAVAATGIQEVGLHRFRISFAAQTLVGTYHVKIGPEVTDLAGTKLDQNRNGVAGEPIEDVYDATFNLVERGPRAQQPRRSSGSALGGRVGDGLLERGQPDRGAAAGRLDRRRVPIGRRQVGHQRHLARDRSSHGRAGSEPGVYADSDRARPRQAAWQLPHSRPRHVANQERESNKADNVLASAAFPLDVRQLAADGTPVHGSLSSGDRADYYAIQVGSGDALRLSLKGHAASGANELYARLGAIPTRQDFDARQAGGGQEQDLVLSSPPGNGMDYVLVYADQVDSVAAYDLSAKTSPVLVTGITPTRHGNAAPGTITVSGAGLDMPRRSSSLVPTERSGRRRRSVSYLPRR